MIRLIKTRFFPYGIPLQRVHRSMATRFNAMPGIANRALIPGRWPHHNIPPRWTLG